MKKNSDLTDFFEDLTYVEQALLGVCFFAGTVTFVMVLLYVVRIVGNLISG